MASTPPRRAALLNTVIVAAGYFLSRVLGIIRDIIISARFGTSDTMDAYQAAFNIPDLLYLVIMGGALGSAFIPVFSGFLSDQQRDAAWKLANGVLNIALIAMIVVAALVAWQANRLVGLIYGTWTPDKQALTVSMLRLLLIQPVLLGVGGLAKATLESFDRFALPALGSNLYNLGIIGGALLIAPWLGVFGLIWGVIIGAVLFVAVQLPGLWQVGFRYAPVFSLRTPGLLRIGWLMAPRVFGQSVWQVGLIFSAGIVAAVGISGAVRANVVALQLMLLPHGLIALSLGTVIFPQLSRAHAAGDTAGFRQVMLGALRTVVFLALPAAIILFVLPEQVIRVLFERGKFDAASTALTAEALRSYALGLVAFAAAEIVVRAFYAMQDTLTPVLVGVATVALNIALATLFVRQGAGLGGVALAFSIAATVETLLLLLVLWRRWRTFDALWAALARMALAALAFGVALAGALALSASWLPWLRAGDMYRWPGDFLLLAAWLTVTCAFAGSIYAGVALLLRLPEAATLLERLRRARRW